MKLFHENSIFFETVKSKVIMSLFETVRLPVSISPRNLYNSLKSIKEYLFANTQMRNTSNLRSIATLLRFRMSKFYISGKIPIPAAKKRASAVKLYLPSRGINLDCTTLFLTAERLAQEVEGLTLTGGKRISAPSVL